jgi:hypothetical protein
MASDCPLTHSAETLMALGSELNPYATTLTTFLSPAFLLYFTLPSTVAKMV